MEYPKDWRRSTMKNPACWYAVRQAHRCRLSMRSVVIIAKPVGIAFYNFQCYSDPY